MQTSALQKHFPYCEVFPTVQYSTVNYHGSLIYLFIAQFFEQYMLWHQHTFIFVSNNQLCMYGFSDVVNLIGKLT